MEDVLGSYLLLLMLLLSLAVVVWFCCSIAINLVKVSQQHKKLRYKALMRENERLRSLLADAANEQRLSKAHRTEVVRRQRNRVVSRNVA